MKLPKFLFDRVKEHNTSLGDNAAFPPEEDFPFDYKILKKRFNDAHEKLQYLSVKTDDINELKTYLGKLLQRCKELEEPIRPNLIKLCENWVNQQLSVPQETVILECELVNEITPKHSFRLMPESSDMRQFDFEDLNDFDNVSKVILKRRLINALIQGVAYNCNIYGDINSELSELNQELPDLYKEISIINDFLLFIQEEHITDKKPSQGACVEVMLGTNGDKTEIYVQGLIFPYLLQETYRGFFELFASHGLPQDNDKATYIINQADFLLAEPWDIRLGVGLWDILSENIKEAKILPYFFTALCEMPVDEFNENLREAFAKTKRGKQFINELIEESQYFVDSNKLIDVNPELDFNKSVIEDDYISSDELDDFVIQEERYDDDTKLLADIIYFNVREEDYGDEEEPDIETVYDILIYDMDGNFLYEDDGISLYELEDIVGDDVSYKISDLECEENTNPSLKQHYKYCLRNFNTYQFGDINETAKVLFKNQLTDYYFGLRGYIMEDGTCIDFYADDHDYICKIPQISDKYEFIALGNIRCAPNFIDFIQEPTYEQRQVLRKLIANSEDLSVDIYSEDSDTPLTSAIYYGNQSPSYVLGEIDRFFNEGIKLSGVYY